MKTAAIITLALVLAGCDRTTDDERPPSPTPAPIIQTADSPAPAPPAAPAFPHASLIGVWSSDGENFDWLIEADSILFEIDMLRHPYQLAGDTLIIDRGDPVIGIQKTRIVRLTADTMFIEDVQSGTTQPLFRLR
jgi:hypothetical protein